MMKSQLLKIVFSALLVTTCALQVRADEYPWNDPHAKVIASGNLEWAPKPFEFQAGSVVRYIDFENGDDANDGKTKAKAWKHHPWDTRATGQAQAFSDVATYVFKRGVHYRIFSKKGEQVLLRADDSGKKSEPIRLTSDPSWGQGQAVIAGSLPIQGTWKKASASDAPKRLDTQGQTVWYIDVSLHPRPDGKPGRMEPVLYEVRKDGTIQDIYLASDVGWEPQSHSFAMQHWNTWDEFRRMGQRGGGYQDDALKGKDPDYFEGGTLWSQYAWVIANATPDRKGIQKGDYDPQKGTLRYKNGSDPVNPGTRYLIENLPQFLDQPNEFYYDRDRARLFVRLGEDRNPNDTRIEMASGLEVLNITDRNHIEVSGLSFRFNGRTDWLSSTNVIQLDGSCTGITIKNCVFEHIGNDAIDASAEANEVLDYLAVNDCDFNWINGGSAIHLKGAGGKTKRTQNLGKLIHGEVLRNRIRNTGLYRHDDHRWSNVAALSLLFPTMGHVAGNIIDTTWGSGIVSQGGAGGKGTVGYDLPMTRILVHHNKSENNALGVNDYGGLSLWQHGPILSYSNILGNSVGHWPGGFFNNGTTNLSYPIYLDAGFKIYNFNNISWAKPYDKKDPLSSTSSAYFNVFGYLNPFTNNTVYGSGTGFGGTSGNRNDYIGNLFVNIHRSFIHVNHGGNPSLIGGDDTGESGIDGATTLAYAHNVFHGDGEAGVVASVKQGAKKDLHAEDLETLEKQMKNYPLRLAELGHKVSSLPIAKAIPTDMTKPSAGDADFRPTRGSAAIDAGATYFVPWPLYATVGEWHFNANHADPTMVLDFHYYPTPAYFNRSMYYRMPVHELKVNNAEVSDYVKSESEDWAPGALSFDGSRLARAEHGKMAKDVIFDWRDVGKKIRSTPPGPWKIQGSTISYPAKARKTLDVHTTNLLVEATFRSEAGHTDSGLAGKFDGTTGYRLFLDSDGKVCFEAGSQGKRVHVTTTKAVNDGKWHHVIAELDRTQRRLTIYLDGKVSNHGDASPLEPYMTLSNKSDFLVGADHTEKKHFRGAIDFLRVCLGTLSDAETDIAELYAWQKAGPVKYDFAGNAPKGRRDAGALEYVGD